MVHRTRKNRTLVLGALLRSVIVYLALIGVITLLVEPGWGSGTWARFVRYELAHIGDAE